MVNRKRQSMAATHRDLLLGRGRLPKADRLGASRRPAVLRRLREAMRVNLEAAEPSDRAEQTLLDIARFAESTDRAVAADGDEPGDDGVTADGSLADAPGAGTPAAGDDALPEYTLYRDGGCHVAPACLSCPLASCIYDRKLSPKQQDRRRRNRHIRALARKGWTSVRLAERFQLSPAQVRRIRAPRRRKG